MSERPRRGKRHQERKFEPPETTTPESETYSQNLYDVLGVSPYATRDEIRTAFTNVVREVHPDIAPEKGAAYTKTHEKRYRDAVKAWEVLQDTEKRAKHDAAVLPVTYVQGPNDSTSGPIDVSQYGFKTGGEVPHDLDNRLNATDTPPTAAEMFGDPRKLDAVMKNTPPSSFGFWNRPEAPFTRNPTSLGGEPLSTEAAPALAVQTQEGLNYLVDPTGRRMSQGYRFINNMQNSDGTSSGIWLATTEGGTTQRILNPKTGGELSNVYERIDLMDGALIGRNAGGYHLLSKTSAREVSEEYDSFEWVYSDASASHKEYLLGHKGGRVAMVNPDTGKRSALYNSIERRPAERITVGILLGREFLLDPHTGQAISGDYEKIKRDRLGRLIGTQFGDHDKELPLHAEEKKGEKPKKKDDHH